jgi:glycosyltransferase involved in cell wall biosynthesis
MKKILYIWKDKYPWDVRVEKFLKSLSAAGYEVFLLARWKGEKQARENIDGINVIRAGYNKSLALMQPVSYNVLWQKEIKNAVEELKPDLLIVREIMLASACAGVARKYNIPVIMDMAENYPAAMKLWKKYYDNILLRFLVHNINLPELVEKKSVPLMDGIITVCPEQARRLEKTYNYNPKNVEVVYNTSSVKDRVRTVTEINMQNIVFGHHGYMTSDKNLINFVRGFLLACRKNDKIMLFLAGEGENYSEIREIVTASEFSERVKLFGKYEYSRLDEIMSMFSIGILPYAPNDFNNYTIHNKLFDYFAYGKPVLASNMQPVENIINETGSGKVYDMSDADRISDAILDFVNEDMKKFAANSLQAAEKYNWENDSKKLVKFIERFL